MADAHQARDREARLQAEADALRRRAEELIDGIADGEFTSVDTADLIQELRVHQIELEMQNEELRGAQHAAQEESEKYYDLFDSAPVGYLTVNSAGMVIEANLTAAHLLGVERQLLVGQPFSAFVDAADRDEHYVRVRAIEKTGEPQSFDLHLSRADHRPGACPSRFWAHLETRRYHGDGETIYRLTFADITERKQAEAGLAARLSITEYAQGHSLDDIIQKAIDEIEGATGSSVGFFHFVDEDQKSLLLQTWSTNTLATQCTAEGKGSHYAVEEAGVWADCLREGRPIIHNDYASLPDRKGMPEGHAKLKRELTVAVFRGEIVKVILGVGNKETDYDDRDLEIAVALADVTLDIVLTKKAEEELRESQTKLQTLFDLLPVGVAALDAEGTPLYANPALEQMLDISEEGLRRGDHRSRTYIRADGTPMPPDEFASSIAARERREVRDVEAGVVDPDGSVTWTSVNASPVESGDWRAIVVTSDITERKAAAESAQKSAALLAAVTDGTSDAVYVKDLEGRYLMVNQAAARAVGKPPEEVIGHDDTVLFPAEEAAAIMAGDRTVLAGGVVETYEEHVTTERGANTIFSATKGPVRDAKGEAIGLFGISRDMTAQNLAAERLRESEAKLKKAQHFARLGSWTWSIKTDELDWSDEMFELFGIDRATFSGSVADVVASAIHPDDREAVEQSNLSVMNEGEPVPLEYRVVWPDGSVHTVWAEAGELVRDEDGNPTVLSGTVQDITARKQVETYRTMDQKILQILNAPEELHDSVGRILSVLKTTTGFDAVGMRLQDGDDFPYIAQSGFPDGFLLTEDSLVQRDEEGNVVLDQDGNVELECTCGLVLLGDSSPEDSILTPYGTFWTNDSFPLLDLAPEDDPRLRPRNQCMAYGYRTMALVPIRDADKTVGLLHFNDKQEGQLTDALIERIELVASHIGEALIRKRVMQSLRESEARFREAVDRLAVSFTSSIELLGQVVETRDPYTAGHERRVAELSVAIAQRLSMPAEQIEQIRIAALVHDIGKISIPAEILSKPGKLSEMEFELIKGHAEAGFNILSSANFEAPVAELVYQHQERSDGSGYPRGLAGVEILDGAKVIIVSDVVEAMSSHRPYRAALGIEVALAEIVRGAGAQYDAAVAEACASVFAEGFEFEDTQFKDPDAQRKSVANATNPGSDD